MTLAVSMLQNHQSYTIPVSFKAQTNSKAKIEPKKADENPISRKGEALNLIKVTFFGGLALGARLLLELFDSEFLFEHAEHSATKLVDKNKQGLNATKRNLCRAGATIGLIAAGVSGFALFYTMVNAPKIAYKSKVQSFEKKKEMDVYIKANAAERDLYEQLGNKADSADEMERDKLKEQYMQMKMAKNQVPDFIDLKKRKGY